MIIKNVVPLILMLAGATLSGCIGQATSIEKYQDTTEPNELILFPDTGTYILNQTTAMSFSGDYKKVDGILYPSTPMMTFKFKIINDTAIEGPKNDLWVKT